MKTCSKCHLEKDDAEFRKRKNQCKKCIREIAKLWYQDNADKAKERSKRYYENNRDKNCDKKKERDDKYRKNNLEKVRERKRLYYKNSLVKHMVMGARKRAKQKKLPFDLEEQDILIPEICPVLGFPLKKSEGTISPDSPSLDRIIPEKGYVKGNVVVISSRANRLKNNATPEELFAIAEFYKKLLEQSKNDGK